MSKAVRRRLAARLGPALRLGVVAIAVGALAALLLFHGAGPLAGLGPAMRYMAPIGDPPGLEQGMTGVRKAITGEWFIGRVGFDPRPSPWTEGGHSCGPDAHFLVEALEPGVMLLPARRLPTVWRVMGPGEPGRRTELELAVFIPRDTGGPEATAAPIPRRVNIRVVSTLDSRTSASGLWRQYRPPGAQPDPGGPAASAPDLEAAPHLANWVQCLYLSEVVQWGSSLGAAAGARIGPFTPGGDSAVEGLLRERAQLAVGVWEDLSTTRAEKTHGPPGEHPDESNTHLPDLSGWYEALWADLQREDIYFRQCDPVHSMRWRFRPLALDAWRQPDHCPMLGPGPPGPATQRTPWRQARHMAKSTALGEYIRQRLDLANGGGTARGPFDHEIAASLERVLCGLEGPRRLVLIGDSLLLQWSTYMRGLLRRRHAMTDDQPCPGGEPGPIPDQAVVFHRIRLLRDSLPATLQTIRQGPWRERDVVILNAGLWEAAYEDLAKYQGQVSTLIEAVRDALAGIPGAQLVVMTTPQVFWTGDDQPGPGPGPTQLPQHVGLNAPRLEAANRLLATAGPVADGRPGPAQLAAARPPGHMPVGKVDASGITSNARHLLVPGDARHWCPAVYAALTARLINSVCS